ncbi:Di-copper centre-containing protein [Agrocybe pediades]|nr:Di-copper centre-containing protein [Agrocybe pediades]
MEYQGHLTSPCFLKPSSSPRKSTFPPSSGASRTDLSPNSVHLGPGKAIQEHCLMRGIDDEFTESLSRETVERVLAQPMFEKFPVELEGGEDRPSEYGSGHLVIGGDLGNLYSSPADPLFFLHHANLDRLWWKWQSMDLRRRLTDISISGKTLPFATPKHKTNVALDFMLKYDRLAASIPIKD